MVKRKILRSKAHQAAFDDLGYVKVDLLPGAALAKVRRLLTTLEPFDRFAPPGGRYHCTFLDTNAEYKREVRRIMEEHLMPLVGDFLVDYELLSGNFYVKPPGAGEFEVHQNWNQVDEDEATSLTIWTPLCETTEANGTLEVVPGSHRLFPDIRTVNAPFFFHDFLDVLKEKYLKPIPMLPGQALIFDDAIIHWSKVNTSDAPREAIQLALHPAEAQPYFYHLDPGNLERFEVFAIDEEFQFTQDVTTIRQGPKGYGRTGYVENRNQLRTEQEFAERLARR